jgi:hypothetical protein
MTRVAQAAPAAMQDRSNNLCELFVDACNLDDSTAQAGRLATLS